MTRPAVSRVATGSANPAHSAALIEVPAGKIAVDGKAVAVGVFAIDRTEVTVRAYERCVTTSKCTPPATDDSACNWPNRKTRGDHPVNCVTLKQAAQYCQRGGQELPSVAEWQLAAGGPESRRYPWGAEHPSNIAVAPPVNGKFAPVPRATIYVGSGTIQRKRIPDRHLSRGVLYGGQHAIGHCRSGWQRR
jgi:formylglycine-generating enzyme required for sulfatase activity